MKKRSDKYPNAKPYPDRHGKRRWRYRVKGFSAELGTDYASDEFERRYNDAVKCKREKADAGAGASRVIPASFSDLVAHFYKLHLPGLEEITKQDYRAVIDPIRRNYGRKTTAGLNMGAVLKLKASMSDTPAQANKMLKRLSQLMDLAVKLGWRKDNPVKGVDPYPISSTGYHTWDEGEISQFYAKHAFGSTAYLAVTLMLYTGAARADACKLGWHSVKDGRIKYRRNKTKKTNGILVDIPIHPVLAKALETVPDGAFTFLQTRQNKSRSPDGLGNAMRKWCNAANLPKCSSHGLRKAICRRLAEAGASPHEIMSISGHITLAMAQKYCAEFGRKDLSDSAMAKLENGPYAEQNLTNHPLRFVKKTTNPLKGNKK